MTPSEPYPLPHLKPRPIQSHKGDFGHALLVGGGPGMAGAITLAALAALRSGAGLTTVAARSHTRLILQTTTPCAMTMPLEESHQGFLAESSAKLLGSKYSQNTVIGIGPGLGRDASQDRMVVELFQKWPGAAVFDADALNALADSKHWQNSNQSPRILTPHPGEWARLSSVPATDPDRQAQAAIDLARQSGVIVVLKSHQTLVTDGTRQYRNTTGNPSLAVGGSGDVLVGMIVAMACQGLEPFDAAVLAVYLHGLAADIAHAQLGTPSTLGTDLIDFLPAAFRQHARSN
jgi:NAD(P)H-hydrate epimerase